jgi:uncharacterized protein YkwD
VNESSFTAAGFTPLADPADDALALINQKRAEVGSSALQRVPKLQAPAENQAQCQADRDRGGHDGCDGSTLEDRLGGLGYSNWAENWVQTQTRDAQEAVDWWMNDPPHRDNMLNSAYTETGLAVASSSSGKYYWTQDFGG